MVLLYLARVISHIAKPKRKGREKKAKEKKGRKRDPSRGGNSVRVDVAIDGGDFSPKPSRY